MSDSTTKAQVIENRKKWAEALRSGSFRQGFSQYQVDEAFCAMGVHNVTFFGDANATGLSFDEMLRPCSLRRADFSAIVAANDRAKKAFTEIADMVDALPVEVP